MLDGKHRQEFVSKTEPAYIFTCLRHTILSHTSAARFIFSEEICKLWSFHVSYYVALLLEGENYQNSLAITAFSCVTTRQRNNIFPYKKYFLPASFQTLPKSFFNVPSTFRSHCMEAYSLSINASNRHLTIKLSEKPCLPLNPAPVLVKLKINLPRSFQNFWIKHFVNYFSKT